MIIIVYRAISVALVMLFTLVSIVSCGEMEENTPVTAPVPDIPVKTGGGTLTIMQCRGEISLALQRAADRYADEHGGLSISVHTIANRGDYNQILRARMLSGEQADIFQLEVPGGFPHMEGRLSDLSDLPWLGGAMPGTLDAVTFGNGIYGVPYSLEGAGLIVNLGIFRKAGIFFGNRPTIESLDEAFKELQDKLYDGDLADLLPELEAVTEFAGLDIEYLGTLAADIFLAGSFPGVSEAALGSYLEPSGSESAGEFFRLMALYSAGSSRDRLNGVSDTQMIERGIASGRVAAIYHGTEAYRRILAANRETAGEIALFPIPVGTELEPKAAVFTGVPVYWCVNAEAAPQAKDEARGFLTWLYQSENGTSEYKNFMAVSPFRIRAKETENPLHTQLLRHISLGYGEQSLHRGAPAGWNDMFADGLRGFYAKELAWDDLIDDLIKSWRYLRDEYDN